MRRIALRGALVLFPALLGTTPAWSAGGETDEGIKKARSSIQALIPGKTADSVVATPISGLYEVMIGPDVLYVTGDGRYLIQGDVIDLETRENLTAPRVAQARTGVLAKAGEESMVIYEPEKTEYTVSVFTDIDCGYCRKLHSKMAGYLEKGIRIRYLFYPRAGEGSSAYQKAVSVWCADDRNGAMDLAKAGKPLEPKECENPVSDHYELGSKLGVRGTPALVLEDGEMLPGYLPPDRLHGYLLTKKKSASP